MNKNISKALSVLLALCMLLCAVPAIAAGENAAADGYRDIGYVAPLIKVPAHNRGAGLPSSFDGRTQGFTYTSIKNQNPYGSCWAHAFISAVETSMIKQGLADDSINLSELQLAKAVYTNPVDPLGNLGNDTVAIGTDDSVLNIGGNDHVAAMAMNRWTGVTDENVMNYASDALYAVDENSVYTDDYYTGLNDAVLYRYLAVNSENRADIKQLITEYGIAVTAYNHSDTSYNSSTHAQYCSTKLQTNHAIAIIGWDDSYSKDNFKEGNRPSGNGAWLARNSWGTWFGDSGYLWISYEDKSLDENFAFVEAASSDEWDNNYQYDGGFGLSMTSASGGVASYFTAQGHERLKAVSVDVMNNTNTTVQVKVFKNVGKKTDTLFYTPVYEGQFRTTYAGIYTHELNNPVELNAGDEFAVFYKIVAPTEQSVWYSYDKSFDWGWLTGTADNSNAVCYSFSTGNIGSEKTGAAFRIKAFTCNADIGTPENLTVTESSGSAALSWSAVEGAAEYEIWSAADLGEYTLEQTVTSTQATLTASGANGILLKYKVRAKNEDVTGSFCDGEALRFDSGATATGLSIGDISVGLGENVQAGAVLSPAGVNDIMVGYTVADSTVATVSPSGLVTGLKAGTTTITGVSRSGAKTARATVTVTHDHRAGAPVTENETASTCTVKGHYDKVVYCLDCGLELSRDTVEKDLLRHTAGNPVKENAVASTCTAKGHYDSVVYCRNCPAELSRETVTTEMLDHTPKAAVKENVIAATCVAGGSYESVVYCKNCGRELSRENKGTMPTGVHRYEGGYCRDCGAAEPVKTCSHMCHKTGLLGTLWKLINIFNRLFKINQYCECGAAHW